MLFALIVGQAFIISSCSNYSSRDSICSEYSKEIYPENDPQYSEFNLQETYQYFLTKFDESSIKNDEYEGYQMLFYSSRNFGILIKIIEISEGARVSVKCIPNLESGFSCTEVDYEIDLSQWITFKKMIAEFNYWTENSIGINTDYLDGYGYLMEGRRPKASKCGKKDYTLVVRGNPEFDKIAALCEQIISFEEIVRPDKGF